MFIDLKWFLLNFEVDGIRYS